LDEGVVGVMDWFVDLEPAVAAAIVSLLVAVLTMIGGAILGPSIKFSFDKRLEWQKLDLAYQSEQRKALKDHIARHRGRFLEAADALSHRFWNYRQNESRGWLAMEGRYSGEVSYYPTTFAYRTLLCLATARQLEREAMFIDATVAADDDFAFLKALKLTMQVWSDTVLFEVHDSPGSGTARLLHDYDARRATDHFFREELVAMTEAFSVGSDETTYKQFRTAIGSDEHPFLDMFRFFDGLRANEGRLRHDRLICAHLVLLTTLNRFGYDFQETEERSARDVLHGMENRTVATNLARLIRRMKLDSDVEFGRLLALIDAFVELPVVAGRRP
jgi:hypothetical protein